MLNTNECTDGRRKLRVARPTAGQIIANERNEEAKCSTAQAFAKTNGSQRRVGWHKIDDESPTIAGYVAQL